MGWLTFWRRRALRPVPVPWEELDDLLALSPKEFEEAVAAILRELGLRRVRRTGHAGDLSVDITAVDRDGNTLAVQCKRYAPGNSVGSEEIQKFFGMAKLHHRADVAAVVTTSDYTRAAYEWTAQHPDIFLINGLDLAATLAKILATPGFETADPVRALAEIGKTPESLAAQAGEERARAGGHRTHEQRAPVCQCHTHDIFWIAQRLEDGRPVIVCPDCGRIGTPEETHEAMLHTRTTYSETIPGLEPLRAAARKREKAQSEHEAKIEEDARLGLLSVRTAVVDRKRERAVRVALTKELGRRPTEQEVKAAIKITLRERSPETTSEHSCEGCERAMPWSRTLNAFWCPTCCHAEFVLDTRLLRTFIPPNV